jgi:hypothetical protein
MADDPIELDRHRGMSEQKATEVRRERQDVVANQAAIRERKHELETALAAKPAATWPELAIKLRSVLEFFADTSEAQDALLKQLIASALDDLARLASNEVASP